MLVKQVRKIFTLSAIVLSLSACGPFAFSSEATPSSETSSETPTTSKEPSVEPSSETKTSENPSEDISSSDISSSDSSSITPSSEEESSSIPEPEFVVETAPYYVDVVIDGAFDRKQTTTFEYGFYADEPQIIYMPLEFALEFVHEADIVPIVDKGLVTLHCPTGVTYSIDAEENKLLVENYDLSNLYSLHQGAPLGLVDSPYAAKIVDDSRSIFHSAEAPTTLDLGAYRLDIVDKDGVPYLPFTIINELVFVDTFYSPIAFNGEAFYFLDFLNGAISVSYTANPYSAYYYSGPFSNQKRSKAFIDFNFDALMFNLDHFYGFLDERFAPFETYLLENEKTIYDDLHSEDELAYEQAIEYVYEAIIGDGHTNARNATSAFGGGNYQRGYYTSSRQKQLSSDATDCYTRRNRSRTPVNTVRYSGNTAILSFDGFVHSYRELTRENVAEIGQGNKDTFALLYSALEEISAHENIEHVVLDITCNGGGDSNALVSMLGLLKREYQATAYNPLSKGFTDLDYQIDANLDGLYDENDGYEGQFEFFILTSAYSFSCANMFPYLAKENGMARIIGEQSGGGACVVRYTATPDGRPVRISGINRTGENGNPAKHDDLGVPVDAAFDRDFFYDDEAISNFVNGL